MNYKLTDRFIQLSEKSGLVENNGKGMAEVAIVKNESELIPNSEKNLSMQPHEKIVFNCDGNEKAYARAISQPFSSQINVSTVAIGGSGGGKGFETVRLLEKEVVSIEDSDVYESFSLGDSIKSFNEIEIMFKASKDEQTESTYLRALSQNISYGEHIKPDFFMSPSFVKFIDDKTVNVFKNKRIADIGIVVFVIITGIR